MTTEEIRNCLKVDDRVIAGGQPTEEDFAKFTHVLGQAGSKKVLIHCAANYRVTAFYSLYAMQNLGWSEEQADALRAAVWKRKYPVWDEFVHNMKSRIKASQS